MIVLLRSHGVELLNTIRGSAYTEPNTVVIPALRSNHTALGVSHQSVQDSGKLAAPVLY